MRECRTYGSVRGAPSNGRPYRDLVPVLVVRSVDFGQTGAKEAIVVLNVRVMDLDPHAGNMDRIDMRWKAPMRLVDIGANIAHAGDHIVTVTCSPP